MRAIHFVLVWFSMLTMSMSNCGTDKNDAAPKNTNTETCFDGEIIKSVKAQTGTIYYHPVENQYALYVSIPGTFDSQDVGFICDKLDTLKKDGLKVNFSGNYFSYKKDRVPPIGGQKYYFLDITSFKTGDQ